MQYAHTARQLLEAAAAVGLSPVGDIGLSGRALRDLRSRVDEYAAALAARIRDGGAPPVDAAGVTALMREVAEQVRRSTTIAAYPEEPVDPVVAAGRTAAGQLREAAVRLGKMTLELAPAHLPETAAADLLQEFADDLGAEVTDLLAYRRYTVTGDRRSLDTTT